LEFVYFALDSGDCVTPTFLRFWFVLCLLAAAGLSIIGGVPLAALPITDLVSPDRPVSWVNVLGAAFVILSYFAAAILIAPILWRLQSLRDKLSGAAVGAIVYGTVGVFAALAFELIGFNIIGCESTTEAWSGTGDSMPLSLIIGVLGGAYAWWQDRRQITSLEFRVS
jgi:hypothetical protein